MAMAAEKTKLFPVSKTAIVKDIQDNQLTGFIALYRSIRDHWIWEDATKFQWWVDILMECNHSDRKVPIGYELIECKRGQTLHSLLEWSKRWRVDVSTVRRFLKLLHSDGMIQPEPLAKTTRITVCNYDSYQIKRHDKDTQSKGEANDEHTPDNTNNNYNNSNKGEIPPAPVYLYSHNGFFDKELSDNAGSPDIEKYKAFIDYLHGMDNDNPISLDNVLSLPKQVSYKKFLTLRKTFLKYHHRTIKDVLDSMEGTKKLRYKYEDAFWVINNWLKNDFTDKKD